MNDANLPEPLTNVPTRRRAVVFKAKSFLLQIRRALQNVYDPVPRFEISDACDDLAIVGSSVLEVWNGRDGIELTLTAGKVQNLRQAVKKIDGIHVSAGQIFSFWKHVGRPSRFRKYANGRELREGCLIPSIGGGLCQLSNALYDAALKADLEIVERHSHSKVVAGSLAESGRDATVFWNYVDLRFRSTSAFRISVKLDSERLTVEIYSDRKVDNRESEVNSFYQAHSVDSCDICEVDDCHRANKRKIDLVGFGKTGYLLDEYTRELDRHVQESAKISDVLFVPINGRTFHRSNYAWSSNTFGVVRQSPFVTAWRSYSSRTLATQGASRQNNLLRMSDKLASSYAGRLSYDQLHLVVQQNLLPYLWLNGHLGGRTFDVLMTALPMSEVQSILDNAYAHNPESKTLADFRADPKLVDAESAALDHARNIITPNRYIAGLFAGKSKLLDWTIPDHQQAKITNTKPVVVFPASTVGRKGCYELRDALEGLEVRLIVLGALIESDDFWKEFNWEQNSNDWFERADLVVLPAYVEHNPHRLLRAAAAGIPVLATDVCGISGVKGVHTVQAGDSRSLRDKIVKILTKKYPPTKQLNSVVISQSNSIEAIH